MEKKKKFKYFITYFDPADPKAERIKTWNFKTLPEARKWQKELKVVWKASAKDFPIKKIKNRKKKR